MPGPFLGRGVHLHTRIPGYLGTRYLKYPGTGTRKPRAGFVWDLCVGFGENTSNRSLISTTRTHPVGSIYKVLRYLKIVSCATKDSITMHHDDCNHIKQ